MESEVLGIDGRECFGVAPLLDGVEFETLIADRAYDSNALREELQERSATAVIPPDRIASRPLNAT